MLRTVTAPQKIIVRFRSQTGLAQMNVFRQDGCDLNRRTHENYCQRKAARFFRPNWKGKLSPRSVPISHIKRRSGVGMENDNKGAIVLLKRHESFPRATKSQLDSEGGCDEDVNFSAFNFLQVARRNFRPFRQFILCQFLTHPLAAHIGTKDLDSLPFFLGYGHDILHRFLIQKMNDTYIVKSFGFCLPAMAGRRAISVSHDQCKRNFSATEGMA
jgi:hypothetical protein